ncbi:MAG: hypothetical protein KY469_10360 [Actinobacteria bacterium]|nr:hypothetical protein [Actinomycetota bacterium]
MAEVRVRLADVDDLPDVCVATGEPTSQRAPLRFRWVPGAQWRWNVMVLPTPLAVAANRRDARTATVVLPVAPEALTRRQRLDRGFRAALFVGAVVLTASVVLGSNALLGLSMIPAGVALVLGDRHRRSLLLGEVDDEDALILRHAHPAFGRALDLRADQIGDVSGT